MKRWVVMKFGGTSVASSGCWRMISDLVEELEERGERPLLVCSAVAGVSDCLSALIDAREAGADAAPLLDDFRRAHEELGRSLGLDVAPLLDPCVEELAALAADLETSDARVRARILATGELLGSRIGAAWLARRGFEVSWVDARDLLEAQTPPHGASPLQRYLEASCPFAPDQELRRRFDKTPRNVVVTQGFIARDDDGETVLLGRGGSDTAAAYLAAKLRARRLEIWTDVPGLFTANPRSVARARLLPRLDYDEAEALAGFGAKVLHPRAIHPVREAGVPLHVRWTGRPEEAGTVVTRSVPGAPLGVKAVASRENICLVTVHRPAGWRPVGFLADVAACFKQHALAIDLVSSAPSVIRATIDLDPAGSRERIPRLLADLRRFADAEVDFEVATVSLVGRSAQASAHRLTPILRTLGAGAALMLSHCASDLSLTVVLERTAADTLVKTLHRDFFEKDSRLGPYWESLTEAPAPAAGAS